MMMTDMMDITHVYGWQLDKGQVRKDNQDSLGAAKIKLVSEDAQRSVGVYMVADGIGSLADSGEASKVAVQTAMQEMMGHLNQQDTPQRISHWLKSAAQVAHHTIQSQRSADAPQGTTMVMAVVIEDMVYIENIGDSRAYILHDGYLRQITKDHTAAQALVDGGVLKPEDVEKHPFRNVLSQALGMEDDIESDSYILTAEPNDYLLLCTDGLYGYVSKEDISDIITKSENVQAASKALTDKANSVGGRDNIAVVVVQLLERES